MDQFIPEWTTSIDRILANERDMQVTQGYNLPHELQVMIVKALTNGTPDYRDALKSRQNIEEISFCTSTDQFWKNGTHLIIECIAFSSTKSIT